MSRRIRLPRTLAIVTGALIVASLVAGCGDDDVLGSDASVDTDARVDTDAPVDAPGSTHMDSITTPTHERIPGKVGEPGPRPGSVALPPDAPRFDPPHPTTTPNVEQPPDSLLDGEHVAYIVDVDVEGRSVVVDVAQWFERDDFDAAVAEGRLPADAECLEYDYCIANAQQRVRTMPVAPDARVSVVDWGRCCDSVRTDDLAHVLVRMREAQDLFLLTVRNGVVVALDEIYRP